MAWKWCNDNCCDYDDCDDAMKENKCKLSKLSISESAAMNWMRNQNAFCKRVDMSSSPSFAFCSHRIDEQIVLFIDLFCCIVFHFNFQYDVRWRSMVSKWRLPHSHYGAHNMQNNNWNELCDRTRASVHLLEVQVKNHGIESSNRRQLYS